MPRIRCLASSIAACLALLAVPAASHAAVVTNGDFETGSLSGWQHADAPNSAGGSWFAYTGTTTPLFPDTVDAPPQGKFAAVTNQGGPGRRILYQDVTVPTGASKYQLSLFVYYRAQAAITSPDNLDYTTPTPNEQYRIDLIRPTAPIDSVAPGDILLSVFRTATGDPVTLAPTQKSFDVTSLAGQTVRIRLAEVDNQDVFNASADAIGINGITVGKPKLNRKKGTAKVPVTVTDPGDLSLTGKGVKPRSASSGAGTTKLVVKVKGKKRKTLNKKGKVKANVTITYSPTGAASPLTEQKKVKLKKS